MAQVQHHPPVGRQCETVARHRRTERVPAQALEPRPVARDRHARVQIETRPPHVRDVGLCPRRTAIRQRTT